MGLGNDPEAAVLPERGILRQTATGMDTVPSSSSFKETEPIPA